MPSSHREHCHLPAQTAQTHRRSKDADPECGRHTHDAGADWIGLDWRALTEHRIGQLFETNESVKPKRRSHAHAMHRTRSSALPPRQADRSFLRKGTRSMPHRKHGTMPCRAGKTAALRRFGWQLIRGGGKLRRRESAQQRLATVHHAHMRPKELIAAMRCDSTRSDQYPQRIASRCYGGDGRSFRRKCRDDRLCCSR